MFNALSTPYTAQNKSTLYIKANESAVYNLANCFLRANMLDPNLVSRTQGAGSSKTTKLYNHHFTNRL